MVRLTLFVHILLLSAAAAEMKQIIYLGRSGSMDPYHADGTVGRLGDALYESLRGEGPASVAAFATFVTPVRSIADVARQPLRDRTHP